MNETLGMLTVFFEEPFWVGIFERMEQGKLSACKVTFGAEPKDYEVWEFILRHYQDLKFSPAIKAELKQSADNPKRRQRNIKKQLQNVGISTKSQQVLLSLLWGVRLRGSLLAFLGSWALTMLSTQSIGMLAGGVAKDTKQASVIASILYFPMLIFSGTTLPIEVMPNAMQKIVSVFPLTQGLTMMKNTFLGISTGSTLLPICVMVGVAALCTILAVCFFRWE